MLDEGRKPGDVEKLQNVSMEELSKLRQDCKNAYPIFVLANEFIPAKRTPKKQMELLRTLVAEQVTIPDNEVPDGIVTNAVAGAKHDTVTLSLDITNYAGKLQIMVQKLTTGWKIVNNFP